MDIPEAHAGGKPDLFSKVGPLPAWAWGAIVVVAFLAYKRFSGGRVPAVVDPGNLVDSSATDPSGVDIGGGGGGGGVGPESSGYNYGDVLAGNYTGTTTGAVFSTNQQWAVYVINNLPKLGYSTADVLSAVTFYLAGMPITEGQRTIIGAAVSNYGSPPLPLPTLGPGAAPVVGDPIVPGAPVPQGTTAGGGGSATLPVSTPSTDWRAKWLAILQDPFINNAYKAQAQTMLDTSGDQAKAAAALNDQLFAQSVTQSPGYTGPAYDGTNKDAVYANAVGGPATAPDTSQYWYNPRTDSVWTSPLPSNYYDIISGVGSSHAPGTTAYGPDGTTLVYTGTDGHVAGTAV